MKLAALQAFELRIPFKAAFKHASAERAATQTIWIEARSQEGRVGFGEGCPREYVTSESLHTAQVFVAAHVGEWIAREWDLGALIDWKSRHQAAIDANPAAWCAVELALLDLLGKTAPRSIESLLDLPEPAGTATYTAVLGHSSPEKFQEQLKFYLRAGFQQFKIKLVGDAAQDRVVVEALRAAGVSPGMVRADANNLWPSADAAIPALRALEFPFFAIEEPLPAGDFEGMRAIGRVLGVKIILDESLLRMSQLEGLGADADRWIVNVRVSKMGGLLRTLDLLRAARRHGIKVIVGAHVGESSLLTRAALAAAAASGELLVAREGAFGTHLLASDVVAHPIMFGAGGRLDVTALQLSGAPGLGLSILAELPRRALVG